VCQPSTISQNEVNKSVADMEVGNTDSRYPGVVNIQQPVASNDFSESVDSEVNEVSRNPSSKSALPMSGGSDNGSFACYSAFEARRKLEDTVNGVRSQTRAQLCTFSPAEFESTPTNTRPRSIDKENTVTAEVVQSKQGHV